MKRRVGSFFMSILVFMALVGVAAVCAIFLPKAVYLTDMQIQFVYSVVSIVIFGLWYYFVFIKGSRRKIFRKGRAKKGRPAMRVVSLIVIALSMYYICTVVVALLSAVNIEWLEYYTGLLESSGVSEGDALSLVCTIILAPVSEEIVFRGLIYRYSNKLLPFWLAGIWQALLFGLMHGNVIQGVYAFAMGIVLFVVLHIGGSLFYSGLVHMAFNAVGMLFAEYLPGWGFMYVISAAALGIGILLFGMSFKKKKR